jgi:uncharacterized protein (DUF488 family)
VRVQTESANSASAFTIGHSNHKVEDFLELLRAYDIEVLVDTRSSPFSKFSPHFTQDNLKLALQEAGRKYLFLGRELGGKPKDAMYYDEDGYVLYWKIAESNQFRQGIERLKNGISKYRVALLCSEEDPLHCHRRLLVGRVLLKSGINVVHIRGNGSAQAEAELDAQHQASTKQMSIFSASTEESEQWRSIQSVSPRKPQLSSSNL